jgi:hypothetical protein
MHDPTYISIRRLPLAKHLHDQRTFGVNRAGNAGGSSN